MTLVVVSPETERSDELAVLAELFAAGLERYHVRKPHMTAAALAEWIERVPPPWRSRLVLHQHHEWVERYGLGGYHWKDVEGAERYSLPRRDRGVTNNAAYLTSRSCHDLATLRAAFGRYDSVFFGPVFPSLSKPGYGPKDGSVGEALGALLLTRSTQERATAVIAIGGITAETAPRAMALGFDGVAVLGAVWQAADPVAAFRELQAEGVGRGLRSAPLAANGVGALPVN